MSCRLSVRRVPTTSTFNCAFKQIRVHTEVYESARIRGSEGISQEVGNQMRRTVGVDRNVSFITNHESRSCHTASFGHYIQHTVIMIHAYIIIIQLHYALWVVNGVCLWGIKHHRNSHRFKCNYYWLFLLGQHSAERFVAHIRATWSLNVRLWVRKGFNRLYTMSCFIARVNCDLEEMRMRCIVGNDAPRACLHEGV